MKDDKILILAVKQNKLLHALGYEPIEDTQFVPVCFMYQTKEDLPVMKVIIERSHFDKIPYMCNVHLVTLGGIEDREGVEEPRPLGKFRKLLKDDGVLV